MSMLVRVLIGSFIILHGIIHPLLVVLPPLEEEEANLNPVNVGGFWTTSWLFGEGMRTRNLLFNLALLTGLVLLTAGVAFMMQMPWARAVWLAGTGMSLMVLVVFWKKDLVYGIGINTLLIAAALLTPWFGG
jgi:hypothetical protein